MVNTLDLGILYENYILDLLRHEYDNIWLTKNIPPDIVKSCNFIKYTDRITCDFGFDILAIKDKTFYFIQCKNFLNSNICINSLSGFFHFVSCYCRNANFKFVVYYNGKISHNVEKNAYIDYINIPFNNNITKDSEEDCAHINTFIPKCYQLEAYAILKGSNIAILNMPCGMGKTYISYLLSQDYDNVIIVSPQRSYAQQIHKVYKSYYAQSKADHFLISMDGLRYAPELGDKNIVSATFNSCDIVNNIVKNMENPFIIVDEYHNLSKDDVNGITELGKLLRVPNTKILLISATPKVLGHDMFNSAKRYEYKWKDAIDNGYLSDYKIYCSPNITINNNAEPDIIKSFNDHLKAYNILFGLKYNGHKKCIIYVNTIAECAIMVEAIKFINMYLKLDVNVGIINSNTSKKNKGIILATFLNSAQVQIICNVHILDEAIDIPECDSIYIISESQNIIKIIQRVCRCNRIVPGKVSGIYIWGSKVESIKDIIINTFNDSNKLVEMKYVIPIDYVEKIRKNVVVDKKVVEDNVFRNIVVIDKKPLGLCCDKCKRFFKGKQNLKYHLKNNVCDGKRIFKCDTCEKIFGERKGLDYHVKKNVCAPKIKLHVCKKCSKPYSHYSSLWSHQRKCNRYSLIIKN